MSNILAPFFIPLVPKIIGHRGACNSTPENTIVSILKAARLGAKWVEVDVRLSSDKVPVIFHDDTLDRTTNSDGLVSKLTLKSLKQLDAGSWYDTIFLGEKIPTLLETINQCLKLKLGVNLEIKPNFDEAQETVKATLSIIQKFEQNLKNNILFSSFNISCLQELLSLAPEWPRGLLLNNLSPDGLDCAKSLNCFSVHPNFECLKNSADINAVTNLGLSIIPYTVNDRSTAKHLLHLGAKSIITDNLEALIPNQFQ
jgi:glycerophosphoryl diester phosphodiesterase